MQDKIKIVGDQQAAYEILQFLANWDEGHLPIEN